MVEKNIRCPTCNANAFHIDKEANGDYILKCMTGVACPRKFKSDRLGDLVKR